VYQGFRKGNKKPLAFKTVQNFDSDVPRYLVREYEILSDLDHPNIIHAYDLFRIGNQVFFAMEYFNALDMDDALGAPVSSSPQKLEKTLFVIAQLVDALRYLHERRIVHCTIVPSSVLVDEDFDVRLVDFEHAQRLDEDESTLWPSGVITGTPYYMAPEQILGNPVSPATDFYALGIVLYEILYGSNLFGSYSFSEILQFKLAGNLTRSMLLEKGASQGMSEVLAKLLHIDPTKRLTNHEQLIELLKQTLSEDSNGRANVELAVRSIDVSSRQERTAGTKLGQVEPVKILFAAADPSDASRLRLGEEFREIQEKLKLAKWRDNFKLELPQLSVRPADISQAMLDVEPQIVHFSGHGTAEGALCFENETGQSHFIQPDALAALFKQFANHVNCVVLNACFSEVQAEAIAQHIEYVIGMNREIGDKGAIAFAIGFYQALGAGRTVEEAFKLGCVQIRLQSIPEYLTPVLKSFGLKILTVLSRIGSGPRTKRGIRDDTGLDITTVTDQLNKLKKNGYVSIERTNGERWAITALGKNLLLNTSHVSSDLSQ